ncbi:MAG: glycosyltransferase family 4 protein [Acidimicrobiales bacterium]
MATIGINLLWLVPGVVGGSEEYTLRLLRGLDQFGSDDLWIRLYGQRALFEAHPDLRSRFEVEVCPDVAAKSLRVVAENSWLATVSRNDDLLHHAGGVIPMVRSQVPLLTVHDLQPLEMPEYFSYAKKRWLATMIPRSVRSARFVLCPSEFTAERISALLGASRSKLRVIRHGHEECEPGVLDPARDADLRERFGRYLLLPAITYRHKRHIDLIVALDRLRDRFGDLSVVITGRADSEAEAIDRLIARLELGDRVHLLGRVSEDELDALYRSASAMVFPSEYEGFGNPVLEAMARGCPVVTTDAAALPEVAGLAGLIVPVGHPVALAGAIARVLDEPGLAEELSAAGVERAKRFSWRDASAQLADCYREALAPQEVRANPPGSGNPPGSPAPTM